MAEASLPVIGVLNGKGNGKRKEGGKTGTGKYL